MCQGSVAHLMRTGYSRTPEKTSSFSRSGPPDPGPAAEVIRAWNFWKSASASPVVIPLTRSVIIEAEAVEIAHPAPWKAMSLTTSPSSVK